MTVSAQVVTQSVRDGIPTSRGVSATTLDALALLGSGTLESMFAVAAPVTLEELQGHPRGRALARPHITAPWLVDVLRSAHASTLFPWEGKSFHFRAGEKEGAGINRVRLGVHMGLFPFHTREAVSVVDGGPCVAIDYDVPTNPAIARPIYDEVRGIHPGLYLGRGMSRRPAREPKLLLWFALDMRIQDRPVAFRDVR